MSTEQNPTATPPRPTATFRGVVAVDGPSGTGKSTVSRRLARELRARYLDTGAMYRAAAVGALRAGVDLDDPEAVARCVADLQIGISTDAAPAQVVLGEEDVTTAIRTDDATRAVTPVSAVPAVRTQLVAQQRDLIGRGRIVVEGRDIGTVVAPGADVKIFLTADPDVRAARRAGETHADATTVRADLERRDHADSTRATSPLTAADDAVVVDTSDLDADQVVARLLAIVAAATAPTAVQSAVGR
ncbi:(d)CMP kinase [Jatrophihabitans sp. YIM 134969]